MTPKKPKVTPTFGSENGVPVTSLRTTFTGTDADADELLEPDEAPVVIVIARVKATGKLTFVPTQRDGEGTPTEYERQQVAQIIGADYALIRREEGTTSLYDDLAKRIAKARQDRKGELPLDEDG